MLILLPGYALTAAYWLYLKHADHWSYRQRCAMWFGSLAIHGGWLAIHLNYAVHGHLNLGSPAGLWWMFAVTLSVLGLIAEEESLEVFPQQDSLEFSRCDMSL